MPRVSVIVPAYNAEAFIKEALDSALAQTHRDVEVIAIDDGSQDGTARVIAEYGDRILVHRQANGGTSTARNAGAALATGEWLAFLDADDVWLPEKLERQLAVSSTPVSYTNRFNFGQRGRVPEIQSDATPLLSGDVFQDLLLRGNFMTASSVMMRRDIFQGLGGFCVDLRLCEDWDLWLRASQHHAFAVCTDAVVGYRFAPTGVSRNFRAMGMARHQVVGRALNSVCGRALPWAIQRQVRAHTFCTNGWDAMQAGARLHALRDYARAAVAWPLAADSYREAFKVCFDR